MFDNAIDAKVEVLQKIKEFVGVKQTLANTVNTVAEKNEVPFEELWKWSLDQLFLDSEVIPAEETKPTEQQPLKRRVVAEKPVASSQLEEYKALETLHLKVMAVTRTTDKEVLAEAIKDGNKRVRIEVVRNKHTPQNIVLNAVANDSNVKVKRIAIRYVNPENQSFLKHHAYNDKGDLEVRQKCVRRIKDRDLLHLLVQHPQAEIVRSALLALKDLS